MKKFIFTILLLLPMVMQAVVYRMPGKVVMQDASSQEYASIEIPAEGSDTIWVSNNVRGKQKQPLLAEQIYCIYFWTYENPAVVSVLYYIPEELPNGRIRAQWGVPTTYGAEGIAYKAYRHYVPNGKTGFIEGKREQYRGDETDHRQKSYEPLYSFLLREGEDAAKRVMINSGWQMPESDNTPSARVSRLAEAEAIPASGQVLAANPAAAEAEANRTKLAAPLRDKHRLAVEYTNYMSNLNQRLLLVYELDWLTYGIFSVNAGLPVKSHSRTGYCHYPERDYCDPTFGFGFGLELGGQLPIKINRNHIISPRMTVGTSMDWIGGELISSKLKEGLNFYHFDAHAGIDYRYQLPKVSLIVGLSYTPDVFYTVDDVGSIMPDGRIACDISGHGCKHLFTTPHRKYGLHLQQGLSLSLALGF